MPFFKPLFKEKSQQKPNEGEAALGKPDRLAEALQRYDLSSDSAEVAWLNEELESLRYTFVIICERSGLRDDAEDVAQEALGLLLAKRKEITYGSTHAFARNILNGLIMNALRRRATAVKRSVDFDKSNPDHGRSTDDLSETSGDTYRQEIAKCRDAALQMLSRDDRDFLLKYQAEVEEQGVRYLADVFKMTKDGVKKKASRLRTRVQELATPCLSRIHYPGLSEAGKHPAPTMDDVEDDTIDEKA